MSYEVYKVIHLTGLAMILLGLGLVAGAFGASSSVPVKLRMTAFLTHGLGMLLTLLGGFGLAARLGLMQGLPGWIYGKLLIWLILGLGISLAKRKAQWPLLLVFGFTAMVALAAGLAIFKP